MRVLQAALASANAPATAFVFKRLASPIEHSGSWWWTGRPEPAGIGTALRPILGGVYPEFTPIQIVVVKLLDGRSRLRLRREFHERETTGPTRRPVGRQIHINNLPDSRQ